MELDGLFLDLYGTITAGDRAAVEGVCKEIVRDSGVGISAHELSVAWGERFFNTLELCSGEGFATLFEIEVRTLRETMRILEKRVDAERYAEKLREYWRNPPLQPEAKAFLDDPPVPVFIVSNADRADAEAALARHGIRVQGVITSEDARSYKPDRVIFEEALKATGWRLERVMHVGDSLHSDVGGAIVAGIRSGWVNRAHRIHDIGTHEADHEFEDLMGLARLLRSEVAVKNGN